MLSLLFLPVAFASTPSTTVAVASVSQSLPLSPSLPASRCHSTVAAASCWQSSGSRFFAPTGVPVRPVALSRRRSRSCCRSGSRVCCSPGRPSVPVLALGLSISSRRYYSRPAGRLRCCPSSATRSRPTSSTSPPVVSGRSASRSFRFLSDFDLRSAIFSMTRFERLPSSQSSCHSVVVLPVWM